MKTFFRKHIYVIITTLLGMLAGFLHWKYIGCLSGTCRIRTVWYMSTAYGALIGYLAGDITVSIVRWFRKRREAGRKQL